MLYGFESKITTKGGESMLVTKRLISKGYYFVEFTKNDRSRILHKSTDKTEAIEFAKNKQAKYKERNKHGMISVFTISTERGAPMQKCFEFFEV